MLPDVSLLEPVISCLGKIEQDPVYHGEGNALIHTRLVLERLRELPAYGALPKDVQELMDVAACLHDLGKMVCSVMEDGRWRSPRHSVVGEKMARALLMTEFDLGGDAESLQRREAICQLVRHHMKPTHLLDGADPERAVRALASAGELTPLFTLERLALLSQADQLGRVCPDQQQLLSEVALFRELAMEQRCFTGAYAYPDAHTRFADLSGRSVAPDLPLYHRTWGPVVMLSGLPGTGKDTYVGNVLRDMPMISLDNLRQEMKIAPTDNQGKLVQAAQERCREFLRRHEPFVFNATNVSQRIRSRWLALFHQYGAATRIVYLETRWSERVRRNAGRRAAVPEEAVARMLDHLEPPLMTEAEEVQWICV